MTTYPLRTRTYNLIPHIYCKVCEGVIKKGERYYSHIGHETHEMCVVK